MRAFKTKKIPKNHTSFLVLIFKIILFRSSAQPEKTAEKDNMQITITGEKVEEETGSGRKVARDVDIESFTVLDQVSISENNTFLQEDSF